MLHIFTKKKMKCQVYIALTCHSAESQDRNVEGLQASLHSRPFNHCIFCWDYDRGVDGDYINERKLFEGAL